MSISQSSTLKLKYLFGKLLCKCLLFLACSIFYSSVYAESCWISSANLDLGTSNAQGSATVSTDVTATCNSNWSQPTSYNMCLVVDSTNPAGNDPRSMISYDLYPAPLLNYQLYYDAARTRNIPSSDLKNQAQCQTFYVAANTGNPSSLIKLYGQVLLGQNVPAAFYKTNNVILKLYFSSRSGSVAPTNLETLASRNMATNSMVVRSNYENSCLIQSATDIDFGVVENLNNPLYGFGLIRLSCPTGTNMKVSLDNGVNAVGSQRRMKNAVGSYIQYNLYKDAGHSQAWQGYTLYAVDNQTIPVYAGIPSQKISSVGQYSDTITVTLTY